MRTHKFWEVGAITLIHFIFSIFSGSQGWYIQFVVVTLAGAAATWYVLKRLHGGIPMLLIVLSPFYLVYVPASIWLKSYWTFPVWIAGILNCLLSYYIVKRVRSSVLKIFLIILLPLIGFFFIMPNHMATLSEEEDISKYQLDKVRLVDSVGSPISTQEFEGKVVLFDIWHSACLPCIKKFPELQALHDRYKSDPEVKIISLNIPLPRDNGKKRLDIIKNYSFGKLFFIDDKEPAKLYVEGVPLILIVDKKLNCRYAGGLNTGWNILTGNAKTIIDKLKKEL